MRNPSLRAVVFACAVALVLTACTTDRTRRKYLAANAAQFTAPPTNPVIVIPGFGVTRLRDPQTGRHVWGTPRAVMRRDWEDDLDLPFDAALSIGTDSLLPDGFAGSRGPINTAYQLVRALETYGGYDEGRSVHAFAYDWRLPAAANAARLESFVADVRRAHGGAKVDVIAHSAGGIVALTWLKLGGGDDDVRNLILLAPPVAGTIEAFRMMVRPERFARRTFGPDVVATWPSVPELLPHEGTVFVDEQGRSLTLDLWSPEAWTQLGVAFERPALFAASLARARAFRTQLDAAPLPANAALHVIAGDCVPTVRRVLMRGDGTFVFYAGELRPDEAHLRPQLFEAGDGTVGVSSAAAAPGHAQLFCDGHQGIATDPNVHRAILRIVRGQ